MTYYHLFFLILDFTNLHLVGMKMMWNMFTFTNSFLEQMIANGRIEIYFYIYIYIYIRF